MQLHGASDSHSREEGVMIIFLRIGADGVFISLDHKLTGHLREYDIAGYNGCGI